MFLQTGSSTFWRGRSWLLCVSYAQLEEFAERFSFQLSLQVLPHRDFFTGI